MSRALSHDSVRQHEVVIAGGGTAGWVAALAAARSGADVLLLERRHHLGGNLSSGLPIFGFFNVQSQQVVKGIAEEFVQRLVRLGGTEGHQVCGLWQSGMVALEPILVKSLVQEMLEEAGVSYLLATQVTDVLVKDNKIDGVLAQKKSGRDLVRGDVFIDCTGDAEVAYQAGVDMLTGSPEDGLGLQPPTLLFRLCNVDVSALRNYLIEHPGDYVTWRLKPGAKVDAQFLRTVPFFLAFPRLLDEARANGDYDSTIDRVMWGMFPFDRALSVNMLRIYAIDGNRSESITDALKQARRDLVKLESFFRKYVPGCQNAYAVDADPELLLRETRRIRGEYTLTAPDVLEGRQFEDSVALGGYYIDIHNTDDVGSSSVLIEGTYGIPYRCLLPLGIDNLLVAGRAISGTREAAGSYRVMATCMAIGEAAGTAAALSVRNAVLPRLLDSGILREHLLRHGALTDWPIPS